MAQLHYDKEELLANYRSTFRILLLALLIGVGGAVVYFFGVILYLGEWGHSKTPEYVSEFGDRIQYEYTGTKLPSYGGPAEPETHHE